MYGIILANKNFIKKYIDKVANEEYGLNNKYIIFLVKYIYIESFFQPCRTKALSLEQLQFCNIQAILILHERKYLMRSSRVILF